jgi:hypothetical protein
MRLLAAGLPMFLPGCQYVYKLFFAVWIWINEILDGGFWGIHNYELIV